MMLPPSSRRVNQRRLNGFICSVSVLGLLVCVGYDRLASSFACLQGLGSVGTGLGTVVALPPAVLEKAHRLLKRRSSQSTCAHLVCTLHCEGKQADMAVSDYGMFSNGIRTSAGHCCEQAGQATMLQETGSQLPETAD
jgi:hypothetical protein